MSASSPLSRDTSRAAERFLLDRLRALSPAQKVALVRRACRATETWKRAGLRLQFPDASEEELRRRAGALRLGPELARAVLGDDLGGDPR